jgi:hypothetical protein
LFQLNVVDAYLRSTIDCVLPLLIKVKRFIFITSAAGAAVLAGPAVAVAPVAQWLNKYNGFDRQRNRLSLDWKFWRECSTMRK